MSTEKDNQQTNFDMSDEDILNMAPPTEEHVEPEQNDEEDIDDGLFSEDSDEGETDDVNVDEEEDEIGEEESGSDDNYEDEETEEENLDQGEDEEDIQSKGVFDGEDSDQEDQDNEKTKVSKSDKKEETKESGINYKEAYEQIFAPFRANGRDVQIENVDQAIRLMQMGAGYNAKMASLKPSLRILKMLEKNSLLDEGKLSYLIDLDKKDPDAISKLVKESGIDPLEMDVEEDTKYQPKNYSVNEKEVELDEVLDDISRTASYQKTLNVVGTQWDDASRQHLSENPSEIKHINDMMEAGIFEKIDAVVHREKMLGKLNGVSDIDAYKQIGKLMLENGMLNGEGITSNTGNQSNKPVANKSMPPKSKSSDSELKNRKRAAGSTTSVPSKNKPKYVNPFDLSEEEFNKLPMP